jgi:Fe-S-cluster containining protein
MDAVGVERERSMAVRRELPQVVPNAECLTCEVCCRFPEADSFLRPYFTGDEIAKAVRSGLDRSAFPDASGSQITLVPNPDGDGYLCPAFDPATHYCRIYADRPLDCRLYPLALMWDAAHEHVLLGWDRKCPYLGETPPPAVAEQAEAAAAWLETDAVLGTIAAHPRLIGRFQEDVTVLRPLPELTARVHAAPRPGTDPRLAPLTASDAARVARALERAAVLDDRALAAYAFPYHAMWTALLPYWWMELDETFYLFARSADGWFMPLIPLGPRPLERTVRTALDVMEAWNGGSPVTRIDNVMAAQRARLLDAGMRFTRSEGDYVYEAPALAALAGDRYKSQRALCNRVEREAAVEVRPYTAADQPGCGALYRRWADQKRTAGPADPLAALLLEDARSAHAVLFDEAAQWGVTGRVACVDGAVRGYTFGYWLTPATYCVLVEVADRSIPGLAQYLFRDTCRQAVEHGARYINAMEDGALPGLRAAKQAYHPAAVIENWTLRGPTG